MIKQRRFLKEVLAEIDNDADKVSFKDYHSVDVPHLLINFNMAIPSNDLLKLVGKLENLRKILFDPSNIFIHITCDPHRLPNLSVASLFSTFIPSAFSIPSERK